MALTDDRNLNKVTETPECVEISALLFPYVRGELDGKTAERVKAHTAVCRSCAEELKKTAELAELIADSGRKPDKPLTEGLFERIEAQEQAAKKKVLFKKRYIAYASTVAAALLVVIGISGGNLVLRGNSKADYSLNGNNRTDLWSAVEKSGGDLSPQAENINNLNDQQEMVTESHRSPTTYSPADSASAADSGKTDTESETSLTIPADEPVSAESVTIEKMVGIYASPYTEYTVYGVIMSAVKGYNYPSDVSDGFVLSKPDIITSYDCCDVYVYSTDVNTALKELSTCLDPVSGYRFGVKSGTTDNDVVIVFCLK